MLTKILCIKGIIKICVVWGIVKRMNQTKASVNWRPKGFLQWLLTILSVIVCFIIIIVAYYIFNPSNMDKIMSLLAWGASIFPIILVVTALIIIVLLALSFGREP